MKRLDDLERRDQLELPPLDGTQRKPAAPIGDRFQRIEAARREREKGNR